MSHEEEKPGLLDRAGSWLRGIGKNSGINLSGAQKALRGDGGGSVGYSGPIDGGAEEVKKPRHKKEPTSSTETPGNASAPDSNARLAAEASADGARESADKALAGMRAQGAPTKATEPQRGKGAAKDAGTSAKSAGGGTSRGTGAGGSSGSGAKNSAKTGSTGCKTLGKPPGYSGAQLNERCVRYEDKANGKTVEAHLCDFTVNSSKGGTLNASMLYYAAYDFLLMAAAFKKEKSRALEIRGDDSHFRSFAQQERMFLQNYTQRGGRWVKRDGMPAVANPYTGTSNHQRGLALDIEVGEMPGKDGGQTGDPFKNPTDTYKWLSDNAYKYGFKNTEGKKAGVREPWHWGHDGTKLYGTSPPGTVNPDALRSDALANAAAEGPNRTGTTQAAGDAAAAARASNAQRADRVSAAASAVGNDLAKADARNRTAARLARGGTLVAPAGLINTRETLYDYATGTWADGNRV